MQTATMMSQNCIVEPLKHKNVQLVIVESLQVLTQSEIWENKHKTLHSKHCILPYTAM